MNNRERQLQDVKKNPSVASGAASTTAPSYGGGPPGLPAPSTFSPSYVELTGWTDWNGTAVARSASMMRDTDSAQFIINLKTAISAEDE
eukprot:4636441-Pyramimonas_sp.AAC.1